MKAFSCLSSDVHYLPKFFKKNELYERYEYKPNENTSKSLLVKMRLCIGQLKK